MLQVAIAVLAFGLAATLQAQSTDANRDSNAAAATSDVSDGTLLSPVSNLNNALPSWLRFDGMFRDRFEGQEHIGFKRSTPNHDLTQLRLMVVITPTSWLQFVGETQDSRIFFNPTATVKDAPPYQNVWDVRQAYVQLGDHSHGWFDVVAGREILAFGDERLIGPSDWLNQGRTFDLARVNLHHEGFDLALFSASVIIARNGVIDHHLQGNNLHGAYGTLKGFIPRASLEPMVFWRVTPAGIKLDENAGRGALNEVTFGARLDGKLPLRFAYDATMVRQTGSLGSDSIGSWAGHWNVSRQFDSWFKLKPFLEANYASGTQDPNGKRWSTFDQIYPSSHDKLGFADQVGWRNIRQVRGGASESPTRGWSFNETYEEFWLASAHDSLYSSSGAPVAQSPDGSAGRHVGGELDFWAKWKWKDTLESGFGVGHFFTGRFLNQTTAGKDFTYPFVYLTYDFTPSKSPAK